jgi:hypothetical protein
VLPLPTVTSVSAAGYLLENPDVSRRYSSPNGGSDNPMVGGLRNPTPENQQETAT